MSRDIDPAIIQSIRDRLKNIARANDEDFNYVVVRYGLERMFYRLSKSEHSDQFVLKGATLFLYWQGEPHRPTMDADFTVMAEMSVEELENIVKNLCNLEIDSEDGVVFLPETIEGQKIREGRAYEGVRVNLKALLGTQDFGVQLDVGFGDSMVPAPEEIDYPVLLDFPAPRLKAYQKETTISEKFQNMIEMGLANSRVKDFYDIWFLCENFEFDGLRLRDAFTETFKRRKTVIPEATPLSLTDEMAQDEVMRTRWTAFLNDLGLTEEDLPLIDVINQIRSFVMPVSRSIHKKEEFNKIWKPDKGRIWG